MKILSVSQFQEWDAYTITHEPVSSLGLMERAATRCFAYLKDDLLIQFPNLIQKKIHVFCGQGNNGGDGLVLARYFKNEGYQVQVYVLKLKESGSIDFEINLQRAQAIDIRVQFLELEEQIVALGNMDICIDALFGSGLTRPLDGLAARCVQHFNTYAQFTASIDIPSGLFGDIDLAIKQDVSAVVQAQKTYTFQAVKSAFLFPETGEFAGEFKLIDIDLHPDFLGQAETDYSYQKRLNLPSKNLHSFGQKWQNGHALIVGGSKGKMGAAILCSKAALRAGAGLVTAHVPSMANGIFQTALPEAMLSLDISDNTISEFPSIKQYSAVGIGPGLGTAPETQLALIDFLANAQFPLVLDADAINCLALAKQQEITFTIPRGSILTPHAKEFDRLFGSNQNTLERLKLAQYFAQQWQVIIVLKGRFTQIIYSDGKVVFNASGNALLASAGSGDVLTGIITSLLAQGLLPIEAAKLAVNWHGQLAERLNEKKYIHVIASDLLDELRF